ncbi:hypothetical protein R4Y45_07015 [Holzapfeliella sp. He02]|uniref:ABC transporter permease n=1 Tax=Holzapfeliella saturejae TaxID=3082953 RepID=A0ABU8SHX3_9LACO
MSVSNQVYYRIKVIGLCLLLVYGFIGLVYYQFEMNINEQIFVTWLETVSDSLTFSVIGLPLSYLVVLSFTIKEKSSIVIIRQQTRIRLFGRDTYDLLKLTIIFVVFSYFPILVINYLKGQPVIDVAFWVHLTAMSLFLVVMGVVMQLSQLIFKQKIVAIVVMISIIFCNYFTYMNPSFFLHDYLPINYMILSSSNYSTSLFQFTIASLLYFIGLISCIEVLVYVGYQKVRLGR